MTTSGTIPVLAAGLFDPGAGRRLLTMPETSTIADIVRVAFPGLAKDALSRVRVMLVNVAGSIVIEEKNWHRVRPRPGAHVVMRLIPAGEDLRTILQVVVSIAAVALGQWWGVGLAGTFGLSAGAWQGIIGLGVTAIGGLLINALVPPVKADKERPSYQISGMRNEMRPDGVVPLVLGKVRYAPPFASSSYSEISGDLQYVRFLATAGYGPVRWSGLRIGETSIDEFDEVTIETREGVPGDAAISLYPRQVYEENIGTELTRPVPRDDAGKVISGPAIETPVVRYTGLDAAGAYAIFSFPAGLVSFDKRGKRHPMTVLIRIRQRPAGATEWQIVDTASIQRRQTEGFNVSFEWAFPTRGRWEVEFTRMTTEHTSDRIQSRSVLSAIQTIRPEYPLAFLRPLALIAGRIKATHQLNGSLDTLNAICSLVCLDYDIATGVWVERETSNPASLFLHVLRSGALARPVPLEGIDIVLLQEWHEFCRVKGLKYDRAIDFEISLRDLLTEVAAAGRARPRHDGLKWGVVIDRPQTLIVDHINPRNSHAFKLARMYLRHPHAFRVKFQDASNDYQPGERIIPWPGHVGPITEIEELELPGKTDPHEIWVEARRRMYEVMHRPDNYSVIQEGPARVVTRGDKVMVSTDVIDRTQFAGRVKSADGRIVEIDEEVRMAADKAYALRWRIGVTEANPVGTSIVREVQTQPGKTTVLYLIGSDVPPAGELVHFGEIATLDMALIVTGIEAGTDFSSIVHMVDAAEIIDTLTDAETPPPWNGRVGGVLDPNLDPPAKPRITRVVSGIEGTGMLDGLVIFLVPGSGGIVPTSRYQIDHRLGTSGAWSTITIPQAAGGSAIDGYLRGNTVQLRARALSAQGTPSDYTTPVTVIVGDEDGELPDGLDDDFVDVTGGLGAITVAWTATSDVKTTHVQVYRSTSATLNRATDAVGDPVPTRPNQNFSLVVGDGTRVNLVVDGTFSSGAADWSFSGGWHIENGRAYHTPDIDGDANQPISLAAGRWYRLSYRTRNITAGTVQASLYGASPVSGAAIGVNGVRRERLQAASGNNAINFHAVDVFNGSIDDVVLFRETNKCLSQGTHRIWLEPQNENGIPGPVLGPINVTVT